MGNREAKSAAWRGRSAAAIVLVLAGAAAVVGAATWHAIPVLVPPAKTAESSSGSETPGPAVEPPSPVTPGDDGAKGPVVLIESEPALVREVTVGGVARLPSGDIQRTYSGQAPSQCPT